MLSNLLAILGLTALCAIWMWFQIWLKRRDPDRPSLHPGCGGCGAHCDKQTPLGD